MLTKLQEGVLLRGGGGVSHAHPKGPSTPSFGTTPQLSSHGLSGGCGQPLASIKTPSGLPGEANWRILNVGQPFVSRAGPNPGGGASRAAPDPLAGGEGAYCSLSKNLISALNPSGLVTSPLFLAPTVSVFLNICLHSTADNSFSKHPNRAISNLNVSQHRRGRQLASTAIR